MRRLATALILISLAMPATAQEHLTIAFWNVENLFDCRHDTLKSDTDFTPQGARHWTPSRLNAKCLAIAKTVLAMSPTQSLNPPAIVGLAEVENAHVLNQLCLSTPLRPLGYQFIHFESPDKRGVDCALLYRPSRFSPFSATAINVSDTTEDFLTRHLLLVEGIADGCDTLHLIVCHLPSKLGGKKAQSHRLAICATIMTLADSLQQANPQHLVMVMGDFNATPHEPPLVDEFRNGRNPHGLIDLVSTLPDTIGTYFYQGHWDKIDHIITNRELPIQVFAPHWLLETTPDGRHARPRRTFKGNTYTGGISDHLPILVEIR